MGRRNTGNARLRFDCGLTLRLRLIGSRIGCPAVLILLPPGKIIAS
jgi:hypothetical protein